MIVYKSSKLSFHRQLNFGTNFYYITFKDFIYFFLERGEGGERREKERERNINWLSPTNSILGTRCTTQACALLRNGTPWPFGLWAGTQSTKPYQAGLGTNFQMGWLAKFFFPPSGTCYSGNYHIFKTSLQNFLSLGFCRLHGPTDGTVVQVGLKGDLIPIHPGLHDRRQLVSSRCTLGLQAHRHLSWPQWKQGVHFLWVHLITKDG